MRAVHRDFCRNCELERRFGRREIHHPWQFLLTALTLGSWSVVWLSLWWRARLRPWRCTYCGWRLRGGGLP